ncbi:MAG: hypothetical protein ACTSWQ_07435, partial [Candidatus Thorarchaeota archaeon]
MGIFDSDYKPHGSVSNQQLAPQRRFADTFFGELVVANTRSGDSVADNVIEDILEGNTARMRMFNKKGKKYGFQANFIFDAYVSEADQLALMITLANHPVDSIVNGVWAVATTRQKDIAEFSQNDDFQEEALDSLAFPGTACVARMMIAGVLTSIQDMYDVTSPTSGAYTVNELTFLLDDGSVYSTGATTLTEPSPLASGGSLTQPSQEGAKGFYATYMSGTKMYHFYSEDEGFNSENETTSTKIAAEIYPIISLQDNWNGEKPYETLPWADPRWEARDRTMKRLGMDFTETSRQIFSWIPPFGLWEWDATYGNQWKQTPKLKSKYSTEQEYHDFLSKEVGVPAMTDPEWSGYAKMWEGKKKECAKKAANPSYELLDGDAEFCADYPTEESYHASLVEDKAKAGENVANITDVHFGIFATAKLLKESNIVALYYTLAPMLKYMNKTPSDLDENQDNDGFNDWDYSDDSGYSNNAGDLNGLVQNGDPTYTMRIETGSFNVKYQMSDWSMCRRFGVADP